MQYPYEIVKTEVTNQTVRITLRNGVSFDVCSNENYVHLHFSGIDHAPEGHCLKATPFAHNTDIPGLPLANYVDIQYTPSRKD